MDPKVKTDTLQKSTVSKLIRDNTTGLAQQTTATTVEYHE